MSVAALGTMAGIYFIRQAESKTIITETAGRPRLCHNLLVARPNYLLTGN